MEETKLQKKRRKGQNENNKELIISACTDLADIYVKRGEYKLAIQEYNILADIYETENKLEFGKVNRGIGEAYMGLHNFKTALEYFKIYLDVSIEQNNELEKQRAYATLGHANLTWYLETQSDPEKTLNTAFKYFMKSLIIAEKLSGISKLEKMDMTSRLFSNLGLVKECLGEYDKALELLNKSIAVCKQNDIYEQLCRGYLSIASLFEKKNDSNEAIQNLNFAIEAAKKLKSNVDLICTALQAKSEVLIKLADFHGAKQLLVKAYKLKTPNINERRVIERHLRIVAQMCYTEDKLVVSSGDSLEMKKLYEIMGDGACELKNYSKAIEYYQRMLIYAENSGITNKELASCYYSLAETYKDNGQFEKAIEYFEKEYELCKNLQDNLNTLSNIADTKESANVSKDEIKKVYEKAFKNCRDCKNLKEERRMINRYIAYLRRNNLNSDVFEMDNYLSTLQDINSEGDSSSEPESEETETKGMVGSELNLDDITDDSDDSDLENRSIEKVPQTVPSRKRSKAFTIKKNQRGETQLHLACINGKLPVVKHLLDQGHPVNVRDYTGWLPLHEACNHGHYEIVKVLLAKGAAINDRGGTLCNGVTPLYDAASNGHLKIVELLLDKGASAIIKTDDGDTPLNILKEWRKKNSPHGEDIYLCESIITRMTEIMQRTGQNVVGSYSDNQNQKENKNITNVENRRILKRKTAIRDRAILLDLDDGYGYDESSIISADTTSEEYCGIDGVDEYQKTIDGFKRKSFTEENRKTSNRKSVPALINSDEVMLDDWLDDDLLNKKTLKKQKLDPIVSAGPSSSKSTSVSPRLRNSFSPQKKAQSTQRKMSEDFVMPDYFFDNDFENDITMEPPQSPVRYQEKLNSEEKSCGNSSIRKTQTSLLETGFSRHNSGNLTSQRNNDRISTRSPLKRNNGTDIAKTKQPKMTSFVRNSSFTEPDSTTPIKKKEAQQPPTPNKTPCLGELMVYVDVKIEGMVFRIPVLLSQVQTKCLGWLAEQAAHKYARKEGTKPQLELETTSGAFLSDEDPLSLLFPLGAVHAEQVTGKIVKMSLPPLVERYREACVQMELDPNKKLCSLLQEISIELNISNKWFQSRALVPLCKALNHQTSLFELNLSGNYLDMSCIKVITLSFPTLCNLATLNLRSTGLNAGHLAEIATIFTTSTTPVLPNLQYLDLSDNFLKDKSLIHLSFITKHLKLTSLNLSDVKFTSNIFIGANNINSELNLKNIQILDLSDNSFEYSDITKIMGWLDFKKIRRLNLSRTVCKEEGILQCIINSLEEGFGRQLESLNLSRCIVQESELYEFLRLTANTRLSDLNLSYNSNLTGISLRRLLECSHLEIITLIGCHNILHYFGDCGENDYLLQDSNQQQKKLLKMSGNFHQYEQKLQALTEIFKNKYEKCYTERQDRLGVTSFSISSKPLELR